jgi:hypothetical protein
VAGRAAGRWGHLANSSHRISAGLETAIPLPWKPQIPANIVGRHRCPVGGVLRGFNSAGPPCDGQRRKIHRLVRPLDCGHSVVWLSRRLAKSATRVQIPVPALEPLRNAGAAAPVISSHPHPPPPRTDLSRRSVGGSSTASTALPASRKTLAGAPLCRPRTWSGVTVPTSPSTRTGPLRGGVDPSSFGSASWCVTKKGRSGANGGPNTSFTR